jgi:hypothetical protein
MVEWYWQGKTEKNSERNLSQGPNRYSAARDRRVTEGALSETEKDGASKGDELLSV